MDCRTARLLLHFAYPCRTELEGSEAEDLESHLAECPPCGAAAQAERRADSRIGQAMLAVPAPDGLRGRLLAQLDAEREAWYRRRIRRGLGIFTAAAALLLVVWAGLALYKAQPARVDVPALGESLFEYVANPSPSAVEERFPARDLKTVAPPETLLNYRLLRYDCATHLQGKRVPLLIFTHGDDQARVYILSSQQFDLVDLLADRPTVGSGYKAEVLLGPADGQPRVAYLVIYTGDSLQPFRP